MEVCLQIHDRVRYTCVYPLTLPDQYKTTHRKELMHMLHNRRKAEIEIISTSKPQQPRMPSPVVRLHSRNTKDGGSAAQQTSPFLDYLLDKISDFVEAYVDA